MEVVIVTAWRRAEFLRAALLRLERAVDQSNVRYLIALDRRYTPQVFAVANGFARDVGRDRVDVVRRSHNYRGNSYNVLTSYREALRMRPRPSLIHLVEDDILVGTDYFTFHRRAHEMTPDVFAVSACRNQYFPLGTEPPGETDAVYRHPSYQSLGVSFRPEMLREVIRHISPAYLVNPVAYCGRHFPGSQIPPANAEQDGLIHRIIEATGSATAYPAVPRAYHVGFTGYHRNGVKLNGTIEERARRLLSMTTAELNQHALSFPDHQAVPLDEQRPGISRVIEWPVS